MDATKLLTDDECFKMQSIKSYAEPKVKPAPLDARDWSIITFILNTGVRVGEFVQIRTNWLYFARQIRPSMEIPKECAKYGSGRIIPLNDKCKEVISYLITFSWFGLWDEENHYAWSGQPKTSPMTVRQVQRIIHERSIYIIGRAITPHTLRHTFASRLLRVASIRVVQELLGHASIQSTQTFTHTNTQELQDAVQKL